MEIKQTKRDTAIIVELAGHLDTSTSPEVEKHVYELIDSGNENLVFDLTHTEFVSSAGLRLFLATAKNMKGGMKTFFFCENLL